jgi:hypothetical protein
MAVTLVYELKRGKENGDGFIFRVEINPSPSSRNYPGAHPFKQDEYVR